jgi:hypothetical protein
MRIRNPAWHPRFFVSFSRNSCRHSLQQDNKTIVRYGSSIEGESRVADPDLDPHYFWKLGPDPHYFWKLDPDPHEIALFLEAGYGSGSVWNCNIVGSWVRIRIKVQSWIRIRIKVINSKALEAQNGAVEGRAFSQWMPGGSKWSPGGSVDR